MLKKVLTNTFFQILGKGVTAGTTLLVTIAIGRSLGPAGFGDFTKIFVFIGYFYILFDLGLNNIFVKVAISKEASQERLFKLLLGLRLVLSFTLVAVAIGIAFALPYNQTSSTGFSPAVKMGIVLGSLTIVTQAILTSANALFQKNLKYSLTAIATIGTSATILAVSAATFWLNGNLLGFVFAYVLGGIVFAASSLFAVSKFFKIPPKPVFEIASFKKLIFTSWPIGLALVVNLVYFRADVLILTYSRPSAEVGFYGLSYQFFEVFLTVPIFTANALYPLLSALFLKDKKAYLKQVKLYFLLFLILSFALVASLFAVSYFIPILYGQDFINAQNSLKILSLGMPFFFASALLWHLLIISNKQKVLPLIYGAGALFNIAANLIFIPMYGYIAAATVTIISEALVALLLLIALRFQSPPSQYQPI